jgi:hypothetical protein
MHADAETRAHAFACPSPHTCTHTRGTCKHTCARTQARKHTGRERERERERERDEEKINMLVYSTPVFAIGCGAKTGFAGRHVFTYLVIIHQQGLHISYEHCTFWVGPRHKDGLSSHSPAPIDDATRHGPLSAVCRQVHLGYAHEERVPALGKHPGLGDVRVPAALPCITRFCS